MTGPFLLSSIGWVATAVFASSYLCKAPGTLRRVQAGAAVLWILYGVMIQAAPVIVANLIVATLALASSWISRRPRPARSDRLPAEPVAVEHP